MPPNFFLARRLIALIRKAVIMMKEFKFDLHYGILTNQRSEKQLKLQFPFYSASNLGENIKNCFIFSVLLGHYLKNVAKKKTKYKQMLNYTLYIRIHIILFFIQI